MQANARGLAKLAGLMANGGALAGGGARLASTRAVDDAHAGTRAVRDDAWGMDIANGGFFDFGTLPRVERMAVEPKVAAAMAVPRLGGQGGSLFLWNREKNVGFAYTMSGMMNGGHGGPRTAPFFDVLRHA